MRRMYTADELGLSRSARRWGADQGKWRHADRNVYAEGPEPLSSLDRALAAVVATGGVASGRVAGVLHGLDAVDVRGPDVTVPPSSNGRRPGARRRLLPPERIVVVDGIRCTDGFQTLVDLAKELSDLEWEQVLESALRKRLVRIEDLEGVRSMRIRRVLALRPAGAKATESLLETLMVQLARTVPWLPPPIRQYEVYDEHGQFVARVDLAWPAYHLFVELDGQHHPGQPVHDARRETAVVAATGWRCGRFTWHEVVHVPRTTARRLAALAAWERTSAWPSLIV